MKSADGVRAESLAINEARERTARDGAPSKEWVEGQPALKYAPLPSVEEQLRASDARREAEALEEEKEAQRLERLSLERLASLAAAERERELAAQAVRRERQEELRREALAEQRAEMVSTCTMLRDVAMELGIATVTEPGGWSVTLCEPAKLDEPSFMKRTSTEVAFDPDVLEAVADDLGDLAREVRGLRERLEKMEGHEHARGVKEGLEKAAAMFQDDRNAEWIGQSERGEIADAILALAKPGAAL
jgi:multidrug efflux pump subunit AcrA (membrane-fusion protein)